MGRFSKRIWAACLAAAVLGAVWTVRYSGPRMVVGHVRAADRAEGVPCLIEINSTSEPFYAPVVIETATGQDFAWVAGSGESIDDVYVAARCKGYEVGVVGGLAVRRGRDTRVGTVTVARVVR